MPEYPDPLGRGDDGLEEFQPLGAELGLLQGDSCDVSAGSGEARDVAGSYRICMGDGDDGDRRCRRFQGPGKERAPRYQQVRLEPDEAAASSASRAALPSTQRYSVRMFTPSFQPRSRRPCPKACHR